MNSNHSIYDDDDNSDNDGMVTYISCFASLAGGTHGLQMNHKEA